MKKAAFAILIIAVLAGGFFAIRKARSHAPVTVNLQITIAPPEKCGSVAGQANSARFKYLVGKESDIKPVLAQKLSVHAVPNSAIIEAQIGVSTKEEGERYSKAFMTALE